MKHLRPLLFIVMLLCTVTMLMPSTPVTAAKTITIKITEAQFNRYLRGLTGGFIRKLTADINDPALIVSAFGKPDGTDEPDQMDLHFGVFLRDGQLVCEAGVVDFPGYGAMGYADIKQVAPDIAAAFDGISSDLFKFILRQVKAKAGSKFTYESVSLADDTLTIVVVK